VCTFGRSEKNIPKLPPKAKRVGNAISKEEHDKLIKRWHTL
jgi:hypothetical protein